MKNLSAKFKLTLWNSLLMTAMAVIILLLLFSFSDDIVALSSTQQLMAVVSDNAGEIEYDDGKLETDDVDFFSNNIYTIVYTEQGELIDGSFPEDLPQDIPLEDKKITEVMVDQTLYYVYDILSPIEDYRHPLWVRGIVSVDETANYINTILQIALFSLPIFIIIGTLGCYLIVKLIFSPIEKIIKTAEDISGSQDLSLRINLENSSKEIRTLATTFDNMLRRLQDAFEAEKQFSQNVSHELRTPTAVILAQCEYALGEGADTNDKEEALQVVNRQAAKMSRLISELLGLMRLERGIEKPQFTQINFSELVGIVCEEQDIIKTKNITLHQDITPDIVLWANQTMMIQLLTNLLSNAYRYGKENGNVNVLLYTEGDRTVLSVEDDGIGIPHEHIEKIWHRFYQVDKARTADRSQSMGLGLSMAKQIALVHGATISVKSTPDSGSVFTVILKTSEF